ncbi:RTA1 like protein-domain-containing protein [Cokeromyces recurvatus]|uniref:RTA1 like protein-domain-containing protein n=1 Tax=Cokeromyces recurvatus TaxID=90255 RepID=UPI002220F6CD|nr:RTA1 like protein-domain-containing protein [Cokeromyces recurvatus]KAI7907992.1 RTA1 like protein-domain-containing protein [Cokeromyces recurvatus]
MPLITQNESNTSQFPFHVSNLPLAVISLVVFIFFTILIAIRAYRSRSRKFIYILSFTGVMEAVGYIFRIMCHNNANITNYAVMQFFLIVSPNALALVNYRALGEVIRLSDVTPKHFYLRRKFVSWFFLCSDYFAFILQGSGGGMQATGNAGMANIGKAIALVGLAIQLFFFFCFGYITIYIRRNPRYQYQVENQSNPKARLTTCLIITLLLLYIRNIYRVAEFAGGYDGVIATTEWVFYVFDTLVVFLCFVVYNILFIANYLPKPGSAFDITVSKLPSSSSSLEMDEARGNCNNKNENY